MTPTTSPFSITSRATPSRELVEYLFTTEVAASFAVSPTEDGELVAHVHWQGQTPVRSWRDVLGVHEDAQLWPCLSGGAFAILLSQDGWPTPDLVTRIFGEQHLHGLLGTQR